MAFVNIQSVGDLAHGLYTRAANLDWPVSLVTSPDGNFPYQLPDFPAPCGPYYSSFTSKRYLVLMESPSNDPNGTVSPRRVLILSSTNGLDWIEENPANHRAGTLLWSEYHPGLGNEGLIYAGYKSGASNADGDLTICPFDIETGVWLVADEIPTGPTLDDTTLTYLGATRRAMFTLLPDGNIVALWQKIVSTRAKCRYSIWNSTTETWGSEVDIDPYGDASTTNTIPVGIASDSVGNTYFIMATVAAPWYFNPEVFCRRLDTDQSTLQALQRPYPLLHDLANQRAPVGPFVISNDLLMMPLDSPHTDVLTGSPPRPQGIPILAMAAATAEPRWNIAWASADRRTEHQNTSVKGRGGSAAASTTDIVMTWPEREMAGNGSLRVARSPVSIGKFSGSIRLYRQKGTFGQSTVGIVGDDGDRYGAAMVVEEPGGYNLIYWEGLVGDIPTITVGGGRGAVFY